MIVYIAALAIRLLLFWGYHSTDFEVHRNWKAITYNLPLKDWYYEATSEWTLDYPPFFAYFEYVLSHGGRYFDENLLKISSKPYESEKTVFFMRLTVILSELVLVWSLYLFKDPGITAMILLNPGLVYLDRN
jgi:alpha-1,3-glucosyltransferase